eukprot:2282090-Amphidinium_carterae.3
MATGFGAVEDGAVEECFRRSKSIPAQPLFALNPIPIVVILKCYGSGLKHHRQQLGRVFCLRVCARMQELKNKTRSDGRRIFSKRLHKYSQQSLAEVYPYHSQNCNQNQNHIPHKIE